MSTRVADSEAASNDDRQQARRIIHVCTIGPTGRCFQFGSPGGDSGSLPFHNSRHMKYGRIPSVHPPRMLIAIVAPGENVGPDGREPPCSCAMRNVQMICTMSVASPTRPGDRADRDVRAELVGNSLERDRSLAEVAALCCAT